MEDFKNNINKGVIQLTPTEWLNQLAILIQKEEAYKNYTIFQILNNHIDLFDSLRDGYEECSTPQEFLEENFYEQ